MSRQGTVFSRHVLWRQCSVVCRGVKVQQGFAKQCNGKVARRKVIRRFVTLRCGKVSQRLVLLG